MAWRSLPYCGLALIWVLALASCASQHAGEARDALIGQPLDRARECLGKPDSVDQLDGGGLVARWSWASPSSSASLPLADLALLPVSALSSVSGSLSVATSGDCRAVATVRGGRIERFVYSGDSGSISGDNAFCAPLVRGCLDKLAQTARSSDTTR